MKNTLIASVGLATVVVMALTTAFAHADDMSVSGDGMKNDSAEHHWQRPKWTVSISPRYYSMNTSGYSQAFTGAGLSTPNSGSVGMDVSLYATTQSNWQLGIGFGGVGTSSDNGANHAEYSDGFFGFWIAKDIPLCDEMDLALGSLFAYGSAHATVFTTGISGETDESAFTLEPKLVVDYKISHWFKIGISGSYLEPIAPNQSIKGNALTNGNISLHGVSGGVEFVIGSFGNKPAT